MKSLINIKLVIASLIIVLTACDKVDELPFYEQGTAAALTASSTSVAPAPADSNNVALTLNWTNPNYATDSANVKYTIEIDSTGKNFSNPFSKEVIGKSSTTFTAKELNNLLLAKGYAFNVPVDMDVRLTTSYANNNERIVGNTVKIKFTPYKIPPKVALPASGRLFIVGDATDFGWTNDPTPAFPAARELTRIDETTWGGIFNLKGTGAYKLLQTQGNWATQFHMISGGSATQGSFEQKDADPAFSSPATAGLYKVIFDFQTGKYSVIPFTQQHGLPSNLFLVGDATSGGWTNPVPIPSQQFTRITSTRFELTVPLTTGKEYLVLPENGNWDKKFGSDGASTNTKLTGKLKPEGGNFAAPDVSGSYKIVVDFIDNSYKLTKL